jgi:hypothetical protein
MTWCNNASAEDVVQPSAASTGEVLSACPPSLRLRAVQFDPHREERSFAVFSGFSLRSQLRPGARVGAYAIERIEQGAVVLVGQAQRCTVRLRGAVAQRELRAIQVDEVRRAMRARTTPVPDGRKLVSRPDAVAVPRS